ncbi:MAG: SurA N-terminal domain-containing protein [Bacteroidia bacterium]|nr:SurA N-terminal domain-containing protein [Bacteroidia bacterium]
MALLNKLRNSTWVLVFVLGALALFVASDYFSSTKYSFSDEQRVGEIDGKEITFIEFDARYKTLLTQIANGQSETQDMKDQASMYAWNQIIQELIIDKEYQKLGIDVSEAEAGALLYSDDAHPTIKQYFSNEGVFSPSNVTNFVKNVARKDPKMMSQFEMIVGNIVNEVKFKKYNALLAKSIYATSLDAEDELISSQGQLNGKSITLNYATIDDKTIKITDDELKAYISKHKDDFKQTASRDIEYILVDVNPSSKDTQALVNELTNELVAFNSTEDDSLFVTLKNSLTPYDTNFQSHGTYNKEIEAKLFSAKKDSAFGPLFYDGGFSIFKVVDTKRDSNYYFHAIRADVTIPGTTKADTTEAFAKAKRLLAESASTSNTLDFFNSKSNTGEVIYAQDMGWVREGSQMEEINKAIKSLPGVGGTVVKTPFGITILKLVEPKSYELIKVAELRKNVEALNETVENAYQKANEFRSNLNSKKEDEFDVLTKKMGINKSIANGIKESDKMVTAIPGTRDVIRWVFNKETEEGDYSDVINCENFFIVAHMVNIKEEGTAEVKDVREKVTKLVMNEKKGEILKAKFEKAMKGATTMEQIALGVESIVQPFNNINFSANGLPFAGNDPKLIGLVCGIKVKTISKPVVTDDGVSVIFVESANYPQIPTDLKLQKGMVYSQAKQQAVNAVTEGLKKLKDVKDERYKFF